MSQDTVLRTRLLPPRVPADLVPRGDLAERAAAVLDAGTLVTITAGAGFGKSTLLAGIASRLVSTWVFLSCDARLDPAQLFTHLAAGIDERFPGFGADVSFTGVPRPEELFVNELVEAVPDETVILLDDVHDLPDRASESALLLAQQLPPHITLAVAGRRPLTAKRLTPARRVLALGEPELVLTKTEATELLRADAKLTDEQVDEAYERTEGWVAGLTLAAQAAALGSFSPTSPDRDLFEYLAAEVLDAERQELQEFLLQTSILDRFSPRLAEAVSGKENAADLCRELVSRHLFTVRLDAEGEWYRYHSLFSDVLNERLTSSRGGELPDLHRRAATALLEDGRRVAAVRHLTRVADYDAAVAELLLAARAMAESPEAAALIELLDEIPEEKWRGHVALVSARAIALLVVGARERSLAEHRAAADLSLEQEDWAAATEILMSLETLQIDRGRLADLADFIGSALDRIPVRSPVIAVLQGGVAMGSLHLSDPAETLARLERARAIDPTPVTQRWLDVVETMAVARFHGSPNETLRALDRDTEFFRSMHVPILSRPTAMVIGIRASLYLWWGYFEEALEHWRGFNSYVAEKFGVGHSLGLSAWGRLACLAGLGRWNELERALSESESGPVPVSETGIWPLYIRPAAAALAASRGEGDTVRTIANAALADTDGFSGQGWDLASSFSDLANVCTWANAAEAAADLGHRALVAAEGLRSPWLEARANAAVARSAGDPESADSALAAALHLSHGHGLHEVWTHKDRRFAPPLLARAIDRSLGPQGYAADVTATAGAEVFAQVVELTRDAPAEVRQELYEAGRVSSTVARADLEGLARVDEPAIAGSARPVDQSKAELRFLSLGGFGLERDGERVPNAAFGRARARAVLASLLAAAGPVARDQLLEWFWPDLDPERGARAFHVTMSGVRRALEPDLERGQASAIVITEGDTYRVRLGEGMTFDAAEFLELVESGLATEDGNQRVAALESALALHGGEPFPEWQYEPWLESFQDRIRRAHMRALEAYGEHLIGLGRAADAAEPLAQLVSIDPGHESGYRALMRAYFAAGERAKALRQFHACRAALGREQGVEPSTKTRDLYAELLGDG